MARSSTIRCALTNRAGTLSASAAPSSWSRSPAEKIKSSAAGSSSVATSSREYDTASGAVRDCVEKNE